MKKSKRWRVSWPSDSKLCQVRMFEREDCPAEVASQSSSKPKASNLPPGFEGTEYAKSLHIPRIRWKRPPKFILNDALLVGSGGESTETRSENLRIAKVLEAFYPHRSLIPTRPLVSPAVDDESYDDSRTPNIRLTPIEDDTEAAAESSRNSKAPAALFGLGPDLSLAASAALSALMKTKEQGSLVDADLLVKFLSDPKIIKNLMMNDTTGKPLETANNLTITKPRLAPQHVTSSAMDRNPKLISFPETRTQPGNGAVSQSSVSVATDPPLPKPTQKPPSALHACTFSTGLKQLPRPQEFYPNAPLKPSPVDDVIVSEHKTVSKPQSQSLHISTSSTWNMNRETETDAQIRNGAYPMNDQVSAKPVKNLDYFKNLIRKHGGVTPATNGINNYKGRVDSNLKVVKVKVQKPCMYFGRARGCRLGESCLYLHDPSQRLWSDVAPELPRAKRIKFGT